VISPAKLAANRRNAQRSTGPRTRSGKARSRTNAWRHGILASQTLIQDGEGREDAEAFNALLESLLKDLKPTGILERLLVERLVVTTWRLRRLLRYELGAVRDQADEAVARWARAQRDAQREAVRERARYPIRYDDSPPLEEWRPTDTLVASAREAAERLQAVSAPEPLDRPSEALAWVLLDCARALGVAVWAVLGVSSEDADEELARLREGGRESAERLLDAIAQARGMSRAEAWEWLRAREQARLEEREDRLAARRREEERIRMLAAIPDDGKLERVMRYEAHLSREFARTLEQLEQRRIRAGGVAAP
jgi:hypothetical protein